MKVPAEISTLSPYVPGLPIEEVRRIYGLKEIYKLASNENPLGPSPMVQAAICDAVKEINLYPDGSCFELKQAVSTHFGVAPDKILFGSGSDELIDLLARTYCERGDSIIASPYGFNAYRIRAQAARAKTIHPPMKSRFRMDLSRMKEVWTPNTKFIFIDNPNNPTSVYYPKSEIDHVLEQFGNRDDVFIVFDEAYTEFVRHKEAVNTLELFNKYKNVLVLRTFSKVYALAGLRLGVLFAPPQVIDYLNRVRLPFNANLLVQRAGIAALKDTEHIRKTCEITWAGLDYFYKELKRLGLPFEESQGNFVFFDTLRDVNLVNTELLKRGIILRPLLSYGIERYLRMSVGLEHENQKAIAAIEEVLKIIPPLAKA